MGRSTVHYVDNQTNNILKKLHNKLRPAGTPVQRVEYIIELLLLRIFEVKIRQDEDFRELRKIFTGEDENKIFSYLFTITNEQILPNLNQNFFPFYANIINKARKVYDGNIPLKVHDNLILVEEVFSNSNFTNNVNSGNLMEVINLIAELDEDRLLNTDLLGDAIESALSETGGTKDIGLYRTPDHIRQFMVGLLEPTFDDIIYDPACGTGGFLFDSYEFVLRRIDHDRKWPGDKSHKELKEWFDKYFKYNQLDFPSTEQTTNFYRNGISGVEYLGMIRKMAAINFYIKGLNPANIEQGDSLAKYNPQIDSQSKSIVLANPPFGAERDQEAYPDVWSEYPKESETTILFVKLMIELLKPGGRCAVIVSEGFHTWDQFSAKTIRKMLLDELKLKAIISLPQGIFVSKNGVGPKTSILVFEKPALTSQQQEDDWIWFYKVTNDGYSMGTNRKEVSGCQLTEGLTLYHEFIKHNKKPPENKHSYTIPVEWIKSLDPRIKEKIKNETRTEMEEKKVIERKKKEVEIKKKIVRKFPELNKKNDLSLHELLKDAKLKDLKISAEEELKQFEDMFKNKTENEIAKRIDKAHNYSLNLQNYLSTLNYDENDSMLSMINKERDLDKIYLTLKSDQAIAEKIKSLNSLNLENAMEADIVREFVFGLEESILFKHEKLKLLKEILYKKKGYSLQKLESLILPTYNKIKKDDYTGEIDIIDKISFEAGKIHFRDDKSTGMDLYKANKGNLISSKINIHQGAVAIAPIDLVCSTHYQVYEIDKMQIIPEYLLTILRTKQFKNKLSEVKNKGIKNEQGAEFLLSQKIPLPTPEEQAEIISQIEKQKMIIEGAEKVIEGWEIDERIFNEFPKVKIKELAELNPTRERNNLNDELMVSFVPMNNINEFDGTIIEKIEKRYSEVKKGYTSFLNKDVLFAKITPCMENGKCFVADDLKNGLGFGTTELHVFRYYPDKVLPEYLFYFLRTKKFRKDAEEKMQGASGHKRVPEDFLINYLYPLTDLTMQQKIIDELDSQMKILKGLKKMKDVTEKRIEKILDEVWGE
ncbi:MAG: N-6 DNA methylase [Bacteroidota bacterium]|nr:N-6 DNA methylase [Bacteroidota bacterium]